MKILTLSKKFPYPIKDGESVAIQSMSKGFVANNCEVSLLALNTSKHFYHSKIRPQALEHYKNIDSVFIDTSINYRKALINVFGKSSFNIQRFNNERFHLRLKKILQNEKFDVIQIESLYMAPYIDTIRENSNAIISMRSHNIESEIWDNLSKGSSNPIKKWYYKLCADRLHNYEVSQFTRYDTLIPISETDYKKYHNLNYGNPYCISPVGFDTSIYSYKKTTDEGNLKLGYIGSLDWKPNIEGVAWFLKNAWQKIYKRYQNIEFHLAGRNAPDQLKNNDANNIIFHGEVDSAIEFLKQLDIVVVPLFSGSGIRVKILESMAMGKIVLSTEKGFEGIPIEDSVNGFLFETENEIIEALDKCKNDKELKSRIEHNAQSLVSDTFDFNVLSKKVVDHYKSLI